MSLPGDLALRRAVAADAPVVADLVDRAYAHYVERIGRLPAPMASDHARAIREHEVWVVVAGVSLAAVIELIDRPDHLFVENVAVDPAHQGRGIGRALLDFAEAEATRRGHRVVRLETNERFTENRAIYHRRGYRETGRESRGGTDVIQLRKELGAGEGPTSGG